jgi:hypothetical protein
MTTLTDRYVWALLRAVPQGQRADLEPELRALVADTMDAHADAGSPDAVERAALLELGDPEALASRYAERPQVLIGPRFYPEWRRLLGILLPIIVPIVAIVAGAARLLDGQPTGEVITSALGAAIGVGIQTVFWFTLVFAVIERTADRDSVLAREWTPDSLPAIPSRERMSVGEAAATVVANLFLIGAILWVQVMSPIVMDGTRYPLFDPALWSFWLPYFIVVSVLEILFALGLYVRGRWTWGFAVVNTALGAAFAIPALWLLQMELLFNPELVAKVEAETGSGWLAVTSMVISLVVVAIVAWDAFDGFRKAYRNSRPTPMVSATV